MSNITTIRRQIATLQAEQKSLANQVRDRDAIKRDVAAHVASREAVADEQASRFLRRMAAGQPTTPLMVQASTPHGPVFIDMLPIFVQVLGAPRMIDVLCEKLNDLPVGMSAEDRAKRLTEITAQLQKLGHQEESLVRQSEAAGTPIERRPDADPACVLAP